MRLLAYFFIVIFYNQCLSQTKFDNVNPCFDVKEYQINLKLFDKSDSIYGNTKILVNKICENQSLSLDFSSNYSIDSIVINGLKSHFSKKNDKVSIMPNLSQNQIQIYYRGVPQDGLIITQNWLGNNSFFADNWPNRAHNWFPCIDHPLDKAKVRFLIDVPKSYDVIANGEFSGWNFYENRKIINYETNYEIPTKVMVFGAANFSTYLHQDIDPVTISWIMDYENIEGHNVFAKAPQILSFFDSLIAPYPFQKMAHVQSKTRYGGMENAGCIFYHEYVLKDPNAETLIAHEIAHQWFGNSVTEKSWQDVWLSEGFATYFTAIYLQNHYGNEKFLEFMEKQKQQLFKFTSTMREKAVVPFGFKKLESMLSVYTYQRGALVLHQIRNILGDDKFFEFINTYYSKYQYQNASTDDFLRILRPLLSASAFEAINESLFHSEIPKIKVSTTQLKSGEFKVDIKQLTKESLWILLELSHPESADLISFHFNEKAFSFITELNPKDFNWQEFENRFLIQINFTQSE